MRVRRLLIFLIVLGLPSVARFATAADLPAAQTGFPLAQVIAEIKREIAAAEATPGARVGLTLSKVDIVCALANIVDVNGKVSIGVPLLPNANLGGGAARKSEQASSVSLTLEPPKAEALMGALPVGDLGITNAIVKTREQLREGLEDEPRLLPRKVTIDFKFAVTTRVSGKGGIKFLVVSVGGEGNWQAAETNTITLVFLRNSAP